MQNDMAPRIEIAGYRDPATNTFELVVLVDGERQDDVTYMVVDPAAITRPMPLSAWRTVAWNATHQASTGFAHTITEFFTRAEGARGVVYDDMHPAKDAQPEAASVDELDPSLWFQAAEVSGRYADRSAACAAVAVRVFHTTDVRTQAQAVKAMLSAYRAASGTQGESLATVVQDLLTDLRHFADARGFRIEAETSEEDLIACAVAEVVEVLGESAVTTWADELAIMPGLAVMPQVALSVFGGVELSAYLAYHEKVAQQA
ncbi:hypothetical protein ACVDFE_00120 [Lentzea chajnantorensis]